MNVRNAGLFGAELLFTAALATGCLAPDATPGGGGGGAGGTSPTGGSDVPLAWADHYGDLFVDQRAFSVAIAKDGDAIVAGDFEGSLTIGSLPTVQNTEGRDAFVFSLDPSGAPHWVTAFQGQGDQLAHRAVPTSDGGVLVAGAFSNTLIFKGNDEGNAPAGRDGFLARLDAQRALVWLVRASGDGRQTIDSVAVTPAGAAIIAGTFTGALDLAGMTLEGDGTGHAEIFVARVSATGAPEWITSLHGDAPDIEPLPSCVVALGPADSIRVAGTFSGAVTFDEDLGAVGDRDMFVGALDAKGKPIWGHAIGSPNVEQRLASLAVGPTGEALISGDLRGKATLDGTVVEAAGDRSDAFLALYEGTGALRWARRYGSSADDRAAAAAFDAGGNIHFAGQFRGAIDFSGSPPLLNVEASANSDDVFFTVLDPARKPLFAAAFGGPDAQVATSLAVSAAGQTYLAGWFRNVVDFGGGPLDAQSGIDIFVAKFGD